MCSLNMNKIPYTLTENDSYNNLDYVDQNPDLGINWWTNGFFAGILWQMYHATGEVCYLDGRENRRANWISVLIF